MGFIHTLRNNTGGYTPTQKKVRDVTSDNILDPVTAEMQEIADLSYVQSEVEPMMQTIYQRMSDKGRYYRHIDKALVLLHYLLCFGSIDVVKSVSGHLALLESLSDYYYVEGGREVCEQIREEARAILALFNNKHKLEHMRHKASLMAQGHKVEHHVKADMPPHYSQAMARS